jgi:membrane-associated protein
MELIKDFIDFILHIDARLVELVSRYGTFSYGILFVIIFCETGLVVTPFLPGDSLLFAVGALSATGALDVYTAAFLMMLAAIIGDSTNYWIGYFAGPKVFRSESSRWLNRKHLERTSQFYEKYGVKTVVIARFMPIVRTFAPFVAGIGRMYYPRFLFFSVLGSILWIGLFVTAGYLFGNIPVVKRNFTLVILAIIFLSILPALIEFARERRSRKPAAGSAEANSRRIDTLR